MVGRFSRQAGLAAAPAILALALSAVSPAAVLDARTVKAGTLHNGLQLIVCEDPDAGVLAVEVVVRVGSADDPPGRSGMAHLLEHVLWAGGGSLPDDPRLRIERIGGVTNAGVLRDYTRFHATVPVDNVELAVDALGEIVLRSDVDPAVVTRERRVIAQECALRRDDPRAFLNDLAFLEVFGGEHPYARRVEGEREEVADIAAPQLALFHRTWYVPNNMAVVVSGRVEYDAVRGVVESAFGGRLPAAVPRRPWPQPDRPSSGGERVVGIPTERAFVMAAFVGPAGDEHRHVVASDLLATLLTEEPVGRLWRALLEDRETAAAVGINFLTQRCRSLFGIWAACEPEDVPEVKRVICRELDRIAEEPPSPTELETAKRLLLAGYAFANETPADRATTLAFYEAIGSYRAASQYASRVRGGTPASLVEVARWYTGEPVWVVLVPEGDAP